MSQVDAKTFDAYYKWLAIPPHEQPPNHYRLLGVALFEEDLDVIAAAADRQMAHVKSFASGKHARQSQQLLNELAKARICLLHPEQKARYDRQLTLQLPADQPSERTFTPPASELDAGGMLTDIQILAGPPSRKRRSSGFANTLVKVILFLVLLMIPAAVIVYRDNLLTTQQLDLNVEAPEPIVPPAQQQQPPQAPQPRQALMEIAPATAPARRKKAPAHNAPAPAQNKPNRQVVILPDKPQRPQQRIVLDLEKKVQRSPITIAQPARVIGMEGSQCRIAPVHGSLESGPVTVTITGPRVITLTIEANSRGQLTITPTVENDEGKEVPFTKVTLDALFRRVVKNGERAVIDGETMQAEKDRIEDWRKSSVVKPLAAVRAAEARVKVLVQLIKEKKELVQAIEMQAKTIGELVEFAYLLHGKSEILLEPVEN